MLAFPEFILQKLDGTSDRMAIELHNAPVERDPAVHGGEETERGRFLNYKDPTRERSSCTTAAVRYGFPTKRLLDGSWEG